MKILAISGSLRAASLNSALLRAAARLAPQGVEVDLFGGMAQIPLFNPDIEASDPAPVAEFRRRILAADALLIASPEFAHGITGVLKNALDWMVGNESFVYKPVALLNASSRALHAHAALREVMTVMSARIIEEASLTLPAFSSRIDEEGMLRDPEISGALLQVMAAIGKAVPSA
ncbi:NADPH-dependent FMN reductase [soil metagenome]